ncbi:Tfp pilus assembly protein FimT [Chryseobacterium defluvii]|uniref:Tfp pilus assembly protein FimT n=1 Tax=Chryseobacterium defluvii TaxID=160396 RepID=A0A840K9L3_9FLAO|nr:hypothetical protein [Chryseobacterium defluvii]MBB4805105.1 Tfp pilus assembly protein FimT [Chryseobacterium defluvii]
MKKNLIVLSLCLGILSYSQVGINTPMPSAAMDIVSKGSDATTKALEINNSSAREMVTLLDNNNFGIGISNPLYNFEIGDYLNNGAYLSLSQTGSNANGQTSLTYFTKRTGNNSLTNATSKGFKWFTLSDTYANATVANSLFLESWSADNPAVTGLSTNRLSNILVINPKGNIGFGTSSPTAKVHIDATNASSGGKGVGTGFCLQDGSQGNLKVLMSDANGNARWDNPSSQYLEQVAVHNTQDYQIAKTTPNTQIPGLTGFTATSTGKYLIQFHCFLQADTSPGNKAFYFIVKKNGTQIKGVETYIYLGGGADAYLAQHIPVIIDVAAGDVITYEFADGTPLPTTLTFKATTGRFANRNIIEVIYMGK